MLMAESSALMIPVRRDRGPAYAMQVSVSSRCAAVSTPRLPQTTKYGPRIPCLRAESPSEGHTPFLRRPDREWLQPATLPDLPEAEHRGFQWRFPGAHHLSNKSGFRLHGSRGFLRPPRPHPYTQALLNAVPRLEGTRGRLRGIPGTVPNPRSLPGGCRFHPRCEKRTDVCSDREPEQDRLGSSHWVTCHNWNE